MNTTSQETYNYTVVRQFAVMTVVWGIVGMLVGVLIAAQLVWPALNFDVPWLTFGRLRPLHTNAVIFAFGGSALFTTSYYVVQRTCHARLAFGPLASFTFWGWNLIILLAAITLPLGITTTKEYAELEWPIDILIAVVWVVVTRIVFFGTIMQAQGGAHLRGQLVLRRADHRGCRAAHLQQPGHSGERLFTKSTPSTPGLQDAMVQWWYGHNAVGFFLTAGFLGMMYYFVPKQAEPTGVFLPPVGRSLLGADRHLHVGWSAPSALHLAARLGTVSRVWCSRCPTGSIMGRHDQRHHDPVGRMAQTSYRPDPQVPDRLAVVLRHVDI